MGRDVMPKAYPMYDRAHGVEQVAIIRNYLEASFYQPPAGGSQWNAQIQQPGPFHDDGLQCAARILWEPTMIFGLSTRKLKNHEEEQAKPPMLSRNKSHAIRVVRSLRSLPHGDPLREGRIRLARHKAAAAKTGLTDKRSSKRKNGNFS